MSYDDEEETSLYVHEPMVVPCTGEILFLDDMSVRHYHFGKRQENNTKRVYGVFTEAEAVFALKSHSRFDLVSLDHDLGLGGGSGGDVVRFMVNNLPQDKWPAVVVVHSQNPIAAKHMVSNLRDVSDHFNCEIKYIPFSNNWSSL